MEEYGPSVEVIFNFSDSLENFLFDVITHQKAEKLEFFVKNKNLVQNLVRCPFYYSERSLFITLKKVGLTFGQAIQIDFGKLWT